VNDSGPPGAFRGAFGIGLRVFVALCAGLLAAHLAHAPLARFARSLGPNPLHETGDIKLGSVILVLGVVYGGLLVVFAAAAALVFAVTRRRP
jgi:hypothetical protein